MSHDVFISYSSTDSAQAQALCAALEAAGLSCWIAPRNIVAGQDWATSIITGLNSSRIMLLLFSAHSNTSPQVANEVERATHKELPIVTVRLEEVALLPHLEYFLSRRHWFEAHVPPFELHLSPLVQAVQQALSLSADEHVSPEPSNPPSAGQDLSLSPGQKPASLDAPIEAPPLRQAQAAHMPAHTGRPLLALPTGTITFLFTDIEGSTRLWEEQPQAMGAALARHDMLLRHAIEDNHGVVFKTIGDVFCAAFPTAPEALAAALTAQLALAAEVWTQGVSLRVRMALHTGAAELRANDYFGQPLNRVARLLSAGHGGQTLLSDVTYDLTRDTLPPAVSLLALGEHRLRDLGRPEPLFQLLHPDLPAEFAPLKSLENPALPNNLPQQITSFIGREKESEEVKTLLAKTRLLTITGSGGSGKTRLALQVAADVLENYPDGAWFVELAPLSDPALVPQTIAQVLGVTEEAGKPIIQTLTAYLKARRLLFLLDNCEHLLSACAHLVDTLARSCPGIRVLASSREGLGIAGETVYRLPSLSLPDLKQVATPTSLSQYEAVRLFVDRATAALPAFVVTNANAPALASVCHRLDGIPLAIELAAARVRSLSVEEINSKLDNRFRLLTGGSRTALPRQQTLRALIDWSFDLLNGQEKTLLCRLSVFAGGWTLAAAEQVGAGENGGGEGIEEWEVLDLLTSLVDKSLVLAQTQGETTRYGLLETVRQYARDRLVESGESLLIHAKHGDCFLTLAEEVKPKLIGAEQGQWLVVLEEEHDNLRQALTLYAEDTEDAEAGEKGLRLGAALQRFWQMRGYLSEGRERLGASLAHPGGQERTKARADALNGVGIMSWMQGDYGGARVLLEESLTIQRELGDKSGIALSLINLGNVANEEGDYGGARVLLEESLTIQRELGDKQGVGISLVNWGILLREQGDYPAAYACLGECLTLCGALGDKRMTAYALDGCADLGCRQQQWEQATCLWGAAAALRQTIGSPLPPADHEKQERERMMVQETLGADAFALAWAQGQAMTMEQAIAYALQEAGNA